MEQLPGVFGSVAPFLQDYGYLALVLVLFVDNIGVPLPSEAILVTAAVYAGAGRLDIIVVLVLAFLASALGGNAGYAVGRFRGRPLVERLGRRFGVTTQRLDRVEGFFVGYGVRIVVVARFAPLLRQFYGLVAGTSEMPLGRFQVANAVGAALWVGLWGSLGYQAADHLQGVSTALTKSGPVVLLALVLAILVSVRRRRRRRLVQLALPAPPRIEIPG
jgi:membrane protein DedA with SNARE-associated domain